MTMYTEADFHRDRSRVEREAREEVLHTWMEDIRGKLLALYTNALQELYRVGLEAMDKAAKDAGEHFGKAGS